MTHPHFISSPPPIGAHRLVFRSNPAQVIDDRETNPLTMHSESAVTIQACYNMPIRLSDHLHLRMIFADPTDEVAVEFTLIWHAACRGQAVDQSPNARKHR